MKRLTNEQAFNVMMAKAELDDLQRTGMGGAEFWSIAFSLFCGALLMIAGIFFLPPDISGKALVAYILVCMILVAAGANYYDKILTKKRIVKLKEMF